MLLLQDAASLSLSFPSPEMIAEMSKKPWPSLIHYDELSLRKLSFSQSPCLQDSLLCFLLCIDWVENKISSREARSQFSKQEPELTRYAI